MDPTKFYHTEKQIYGDTHVDDGHAAGTSESLWWMLGALKDVGIALKDAIPRGIGDSYKLVQRRHERLPEGMRIAQNPRYIEDRRDGEGHFRYRSLGDVFRRAHTE